MNNTISSTPGAGPWQPNTGHIFSSDTLTRSLGKKRSYSKGNSARSHMCILLVSHYSLILRNKKHCRKFEYNNIDYNLKKLFQYVASNNQY